MESSRVPSVSRSQQRLFGMIHAIQKGTMKSLDGKLSRIAKSISPEDARHFAETKHDKLPEKAGFAKSLRKAPQLEKQMTMDGQKQAVTRRSWDDARFESVVGALSKVKVPKVKKPEKEEQTVDMSKQSVATQLGRLLGKTAALNLPAIAGDSVRQGMHFAVPGALIGAAYGAGSAPKGERLRGAEQGVIPGAAGGFGLGAGAVGGLGLGAMAGEGLTKNLVHVKDPNQRALLIGLLALAGMGTGGFAGLKAGKGLGRLVSPAPVAQAKTAGCGGKKKKKMKKGK